MGARSFLGMALHMEELLHLSSGGCISQELLLGSITATELSTAGAAGALGVSSIISAGCKRQLLGRTGGPGAAPDMAGPCRSCCVITAHTGRCHGHSWRSTAGKSTGDRWHPRLCPSHAPLLGLGARAFWWRGSGHGPAQKGLAFLMATRQLGVWLNCSAVAKEPRCSQETDGCAQ